MRTLSDFIRNGFVLESNKAPLTPKSETKVNVFKVGDVIRNTLTGCKSTITVCGFDTEGQWVHATNKNGETFVYGKRYLANCELIGGAK